MMMEQSGDADESIGAQMYTITGSSNHYVAVACILCNSWKTISYNYHSRMIALIEWRMVQFGFLSAYDLLDLYMYFKKVMQTDTIK